MNIKITPLYIGILLSITWVFSSPVLSQELWITRAKIVDVKTGKISPPSNVFIKNGRIQKITPAKKLPHAPLLDAKGAYLVPGLIDAHVHLGAIPGFRGDHEMKYPKIKKEYFDQMLKSYLYFGFTTVIDLAVIDRKLIDRLKKQKIRPDIYDCDSPLALANGYPMAFMPKTVRFQQFKNFLYDKRQKGEIPSKYKPNQHTVKAAIERAKNNGAICIKAHNEPGYAGKKLPTPTPEHFQDLVKYSKKAKIPLLVHANSFATQQLAFNNGVRIFAHGMWNWPRPKNKEVAPVAVSLAKKLASASVKTMPTIQVLTGNQSLFDPKYLDHPHVKKVAPASLINWYKTKEGKWFRNLIADEIKEFSGKDEFTKYEGIVRRPRLAASLIAKSGGEILFGSDTPAAPTYGNLPGINGYRELNELEGAGFTNLKVLQSATVVNAKVFGLEEDLGSIEVGKKANLLILEKNPLDSMKNFDSIAKVIMNGQVIERKTLAAQ